MTKNDKHLIKTVNIILAGGLSSRMGGGDKSILALGNQTILEQVLERVNTNKEETALNANGNPQRFFDYNLPVVPDIITGNAGPLAGIHAGMVWAKSLKSKPTHIITVAADTPFFPSSLKSDFKAKCLATNSDIILASSNKNRQPVFGLWAIALLPDLEKWMDETDHFKVFAWVKTHSHSFCNYSFNDENEIDPFFNINTPQDLVLANKHIEKPIS